MAFCTGSGSIPTNHETSYLFLMSFLLAAAYNEVLLRSSLLLMSPARLACLAFLFACNGDFCGLACALCASREPL